MIKFGSFSSDRTIFDDRCGKAPGASKTGAAGALQNLRSALRLAESAASLQAGSLKALKDAPGRHFVIPPDAKAQ